MVSKIQLITKDKHLNYTPNCMKYFNNGQFLVIGGTNKQLNLYTRYDSSPRPFIELDD